jgi:uncharacterized protein YabE (DUF348 family)
VGSVYGAVTVAMVAGTTAFVGLDKNVSISVDGHVTHVRTYAGTVNTVLHRAGVIVGAHDAIAPALSASVHSGTTINILRGRPVTLIIDGVEKHAWVNGDNVDEVLQQVGLRVPDAALSTSRGTRVPLAGIEIGIDRPHEMTVHVDNATRTVVSMKTTVAGVLDEAGITVGPTDLLFPDAQTRPTDGLSIVIVRVTGNEQVETESVPFTSATVKDPTALIGTKKVKQVGKNGVLTRTYSIAFSDGVPTSKTLVSAVVTTAPVQQITAIGTKPKPKPPVFVVAADGLNWAALARCESGGRANANDPPFYGLYQFRLGTWQAVGGKGLPSDATAAEQTYRAQLLYKRSNWRGQWPVCGHYLFS